MSDSVGLCGYSLGRFVPSRQAFVGRRHVAFYSSAQSHDASSEPSVFISIAPVDDLKAHCGVDWPHDVGRAPNGDVVWIKAPIEIRATGSDITESDITDSPMSYYLIDRESHTSSANRPESTVPLEEVVTGWSSTGRQLTQRAAVFVVRQKSRVGEFLSAQKMPRGRKARMLAVFGAVGAVALLGLLLSLGSGSQRAPMDSTSSPMPAVAGDRLAVSGAPTKEDPIDYAIAEVAAGRVHLEGMTTKGELFRDGTIDGRVVSRSGDIVLVEVSLTISETKTFATLLLQDEEGGWRTRDVFEEGLYIPKSPSKAASSRRSLTAVRKRAASAPSMMRWSYERAR